MSAKSSLFNRLVERERAIVTATPGTTRDLVTETVAIGGIPVKLIDTAGIRRALDEAESIGIRKSLETIADADLVLVVRDSSQPVTPEDEELLKPIAGRPSILVENKCDLMASNLNLSEPSEPLPLLEKAFPSYETKSFATLEVNLGIQAETGFLTNVRHQSRVRESMAALETAQSAVANKIPHEMLLLDLYNALRPLDEITGATTNDDILNLIFSTFLYRKVEREIDAV